MKLLFAGLIAASTMIVGAPAMAQSVYVGPNGVGVGIGPGTNGDRFNRRDEFRGRRDVYEGRSAYRPGRGEYRDRY